MRATVFRILSLAIAILVCEAGLQVARFASPQVRFLLASQWGRQFEEDRALGHRMSPYLPGLDQRGYRNPAPLARAEILALGDSYTYGMPARPEEAWPLVLETLTGRTTYNAGVMGYGFCEYEVVLSELISLQPELVVVGVFVGNDLGDVYRTVYLGGRCPHLATGNPDDLALFRSLDAEATIADRAIQLGWDQVPEAPGDPGALPGLRSALSQRSALYGMARELRYRARPRVPWDFEHSAAVPHSYVWQEVPKIRTVFKRPEMMALNLELEDPRIREGLRMAGVSLTSIRDTLATRGTDLLVVLIPDKSAVYEPVISGGSAPPPPGFVRLASLDGEVRGALSRILEAEGIEVVDVTAALTETLREGVAVYPESDDHHNSAQGYRVIAEVIAERIRHR